MATNVVVGMMDSAYFVGRKAILDWLNELCRLNLIKIEETASGAVACQVIDALFPGVVTMQKVNWGAKSDYEYIQNYKILQNAFNKLKIDKKIEVDRLIRARYQDNLEFMQWLKKFAEVNHYEDIENYDAISAREKGKGFKHFKPAQIAVNKTNKQKPIKVRNMDPSTIPRRVNDHISSDRDDPSVEKELKEKRVLDLETKVKGLETKIRSSEEELAGLERERDFYFNKLREVEILLQTYSGEDIELMRNILKILYATDDDVDGETALAAADAAIKAAKEARKQDGIIKNEVEQTETKLDEEKNESQENQF